MQNSSGISSVVSEKSFGKIKKVIDKRNGIWYYMYATRLWDCCVKGIWAVGRRLIRSVTDTEKNTPIKQSVETLSFFYKILLTNAMVYGIIKIQKIKPKENKQWKKNLHQFT